MHPYYIFLKPEYDKDKIARNSFRDFFGTLNNSLIIEQVNATDSKGIDILKSGILRARYTDSTGKILNFTYLEQFNTIMTEYDPISLKILADFEKSLNFPAFIEGEAGEEY